MKHLVTLIYFNLLLRSYYLIIRKRFTPFGASWKHFLMFFNVIDGQPCWSTKFSKHCIPLVAPVIWSTGALPQATTHNIIYSASLDWLVWDRLISLFGLLHLLPYTLLFWERFVNFKFVLIFKFAQLIFFLWWWDSNSEPIDS